MSIETYLKEINNEVVNESAVVGGILGILLLTVGVGYGAYNMIKNDYKKYVEEPKLKAIQEKDEKEKINIQSRLEKKEKQKELLKKYGGTKEELIKLVINDVKKMVNKINRESKIKDSDIYKKVQDESSHYSKKVQEENKNYKLTLITDTSEMDDGGGHIQIVPKSSPFEYSWITHDIVKALDIKYKDAVELNIISFEPGYSEDGHVEIR